MRRLLLIPTLSLAELMAYVLGRDMWTLMMYDPANSGEAFAAGLLFALDFMLLMVLTIGACRAIIWCLNSR